MQLCWVRKRMDFAGRYKWTPEELDVDRPLVPLASLVDDKQQLVETLFSVFSSRQIRRMMPHNLRDIPLQILKDICIIEIKDNGLVDDQTILSILQPKRVSPDKNGDAAVAIEPVSQSDELPDTAFFFSSPVVANETHPNESTQVCDNNTQVNEKVEDSESHMEDVFDVVDLRIRESLHHKHKIPLEDLDLSREIVPITDKLNGASELVNLLFLILTNEEIDELKPSSLDLTVDELRGKCVRIVEEMTGWEVREAATGERGAGAAVGIRPGGKRSDTLPAETNDDESEEEERKAGKKREEDGGKRGADAVEIKDLAMDEDRNERKTKQRRMDRSNTTTATEEAICEPGTGEKDVCVPGKRAQDQEAELQEKDHPSNEKSNERWMNFCPEETRKEIEILEDRARTLRSMLLRLESRKRSRSQRKRSLPQPTATASSPVPQHSSELDMIVVTSRIREEDEDSLDRELIGADA